MSICVMTEEVKASVGDKEGPPSHSGVGQEGFTAVVAVDKALKGTGGGETALQAEGPACIREPRCEKKNAPNGQEL